jgi:hypothetical protein
LKVEKDQTGMGPERNTEKLQRAVTIVRPSPRFDNEAAEV